MNQNTPDIKTKLWGRYHLKSKLIAEYVSVSIIIDWALVLDQRLRRPHHNNYLGSGGGAGRASDRRADSRRGPWARPRIGGRAPRRYVHVFCLPWIWNSKNVTLSLHTGIRIHIHVKGMVISFSHIFFFFRELNFVFVRLQICFRKIMFYRRLFASISVHNENKLMDYFSIIKNNVSKTKLLIATIPCILNEGHKFASPAKWRIHENPIW